MTNPFDKLAANSKASAHVDESTVKDATLGSRQCPQCGASRPEGTDISHCTYCGFEFMVVPLPVKREREHE
jgi:hypothetical protein